MSPFASRNVFEHVGRGVGAALLIILAIWLLSAPGFLGGAIAAASIVAAAVLLRGCPMCWFIGLIETASTSTRKGHHP